MDCAKLLSGIEIMKRGGSHLRNADSNMSWLITGGSGQLGISLSNELTKQGIIFQAWSSQDLDIRQKENAKDEIFKLSPKVIVNCAAWTDVDGAENHEQFATEVNAIGAENIAVAAKNCKARLIQVSTDYVFSGKSNAPWSVDSEISPNTAYGRTKAEGEKRVLATYPENSYILRTAWLYSPWRKNFAKTMLKKAIYGDNEVLVVNDQLGQPTSAIDLAKQIIKLVESDSSAGIYHGTNSGSATWFDFARYLFEKAGADVSRVRPVESTRYRSQAVRPEFSVLDHKKWSTTTIGEMQNWKMALDEQFSLILEAVMKDGGEIA
jgi:dTDP-4-dehydrorhamnose reductase